MTESPADMIAAIRPLREVGFAIHWLRPKSKKPVDDGWSELPVASLDALVSTFLPNYNAGVRLGQYSRVGGLYLHVLDVDIRDNERAGDALGALHGFFTVETIAKLPTVISGSGGESRHFYFLTDKPFRSRKLAHSKGRFIDSKGKWHWDWEIELFGTSKQVVIPPSIHPDTNLPYRWLKPCDLTLMDLGAEAVIPSASIEIIGGRLDGDDTPVKPPGDFTDDQVNKILADLAAERADDYEQWISVGQALHHHYSGSDAGREAWDRWSKQSPSYEAREIPKKWRSFGKINREPITLASIVVWVKQDRFQASFDEVDESDPSPAKSGFDEDDLDDLLGTGVTKSEEPDEIDLIGDASVSGPTLKWTSYFDLNEEGGIKGTLPNIELIIRNDNRFKSLATFNSFSQEIVQRVSPGTFVPTQQRAKKQKQLHGPLWVVNDTVNGDLWDDSRDNAIRAVIESPKTQGGYGIKVTDRDLTAAIDLSARESTFHPVREYLTSVAWDGVPRVEDLFIRYVHAPDTPYSRAVARTMMVAGVTRVFEPGHKFDFAVILEGLQGKRKSTFISTLARRWFAELEGDFGDPKQMIELMQGAWILEIPELTQFGTQDIRQIKAFISRQKDKARLAYARRAGVFPRQCIMIGSTNDDKYLRDQTGGRRFWPVHCHLDEDEEIDTAALEVEIDQLWAEATALYREMRSKQPKGTLPLYLVDSAAKDEAVRLQESRLVETADDGIAGQIIAWLDRPVSSGFDDDETVPPVLRSETCLLQIWVECLGRDQSQYANNPSSAQMLGRAMSLIKTWSRSGWTNFDRYGRQRLYSRGGRLGRLQRAGVWDDRLLTN